MTVLRWPECLSLLTHQHWELDLETLKSMIKALFKAQVMAMYGVIVFLKAHHFCGENVSRQFQLVFIYYWYWVWADFHRSTQVVFCRQPTFCPSKDSQTCWFQQRQPLGFGMRFSIFHHEIRDLYYSSDKANAPSKQCSSCYPLLHFELNRESVYSFFYISNKINLVIKFR